MSGILQILDIFANIGIFGALVIQLLYCYCVVNKNAIKAIMFSKWNVSTSMLFSNLKLFKLVDINVLQTCCLVCKSLHKLILSECVCIFITNIEMHSYHTCSKDNIYICCHRHLKFVSHHTIC